MFLEPARYRDTLCSVNFVLIGPGYHCRPCEGREQAKRFFGRLLGWRWALVPEIWADARLSWWLMGQSRGQGTHLAPVRAHWASGYSLPCNVGEFTLTGYSLQKLWCSSSKKAEDSTATPLPLPSPKLLYFKY